LIVILLCPATLLSFSFLSVLIQPLST
jgi:hypothetical protein